MRNSNRPIDEDFERRMDAQSDPFYGIDAMVDRMLADDGGDQDKEVEQ